MAAESADPLACVRLERDAHDAEAARGHAARAFGIGRAGASLVRPDGFVAWRTRVPPPSEAGSARELRHVLDRALAHASWAADGGRRHERQPGTPVALLSVSSARRRARRGGRQCVDECQLDEVVKCVQCGCDTRLGRERAYVVSDYAALCFPCAVACGGIYDDAKREWVQLPVITGLHRVESRPPSSFPVIRGSQRCTE